MVKDTPENQLAGCIAKYTPETGDLTEAALGKRQTRLPGAVIAVYDNYNALTIGFGPTERVSHVIFSLAIYPRWVNLSCIGGAALPDPENLLHGVGKTVRNVTLQSADDSDKLAVQTLIAHAVESAAKPIDPTLPGRLVVKSISAKQRPRRP